jgi:signal transduction histidine kinase
MATLCCKAALAQIVAGLKHAQCCIDGSANILGMCLQTRVDRLSMMCFAAFMFGAGVLASAGFMDQPITALDSWSIPAICAAFALTAGVGMALLPIAFLSNARSLGQQNAARATLILLVQTAITFLLIFQNWTPSTLPFTPFGSTYERWERPLHYWYWLTAAIPPVAGIAKISRHTPATCAYLFIAHSVSIIFGYAATLQTTLWAWILLLSLSVLPFLYTMQVISQCLWHAQSSPLNKSAVRAVGPILMGAWISIPLVWFCIACEAFPAGSDNFVYLFLDMVLKSCFGIILIATDSRKWEHGITREMAALDLERVKANTSNKATQQFLRWIFHEFRVPLQAIVLAADDLHEGLNDSVDLQRAREAGETVMESAMSMRKLLNDAISLATIDEGKLYLKYDLFPLSEMISSAIQPFYYVASRKQMHLRVENDSNLPDCVRGDRDRLQQVVTTFLSNAFRFSTHAGSTITVRITRVQVTAGRNSPSARRIDSVCIAVQDEGIGVNEVDQVKLFSPFVLIKAGASQKGNCTGLGLAICKRIVELSGGTVGVTTSEGKGSTFFFMIPVDREKPKDEDCIISVNTILEDADGVENPFGTETPMPHRNAFGSAQSSHNSSGGGSANSHNSGRQITDSLTSAAVWAQRSGVQLDERAQVLPHPADAFELMMTSSQSPVGSVRRTGDSGSAEEVKCAGTGVRKPTEADCPTLPPAVLAVAVVVDDVRVSALLI